MAFGIAGALHGWPGWVGLAIAAGSLAGYIGLAVVAHQAGALVDAGPGGATGGLGRGVGHDGFDPKPAWNRWWRLAIAVPFRWRGIRRTRNIDYWGDGNYRHKLDILSRRRVRPEGAPVLVYIHGGAWVIGDKRQQGIPMMHELVRRGWVCVAINYRLSPRATWPAHIVDCKRAVAWVREHIAEYGGDPELHRRLRRVGRGPSLVAPGPHPQRARLAAGLRGDRHLGRRLPSLLRRLRHDRSTPACRGLRPRTGGPPRAAGDEGDDGGRPPRCSSRPPRTTG